jgi:hypothetical protein
MSILNLVGWFLIAVPFIVITYCTVVYSGLKVAILSWVIALIIAGMIGAGVFLATS